MKKRTWLFSGLGFLIFGGLAISACSVVPNPNLNPDFDVIEDTEQDYFVNKLFDTKYLRATLDVNVTYKHEDEEKPLDKYHVTGNATFDLNSLDDIATEVSLSLDMNDADVVAKKLFPDINLDFTYVNSTVYVDINNRAVKLETDKFSELLDLVLGNGSGDDSSSSSGDTTNIAGLGIKDIVTNLANMTVTKEGESYKYVAKTTGDQPDLVMTSDLDYKITSLSITGIKYESFTIDIGLNTTALESLDHPIVSPESDAKPYIDLTNYFGVFRKIRTILDDEVFGMDYVLDLHHYNPDVPNSTVFLGYTTGDLNMSLSDTVVDLKGNIYVNDPKTPDKDPGDYKTTYHGQYHDECVYLQYNLNNGEPYKLAYTNSGMGDMWDFLGDEFEELFGINFFDLIFGGNGAEFPIIDIMIDAAYRDLAKYGKIYIGSNYIELTIDNTLLHGRGTGYVKINLDSNKDIESITITTLDINSYVVDGYLVFDQYETVRKEKMSDGYSCIDELSNLLRSGATYYKSNKYNIGLDLTITDPKNSDKTLSTKGTSFQVNITPKLKANDEEKTEYLIEGYMDLKVNDFFGHVHNLKVNGSTEDKANLYATYNYKQDKNDEVNKELKLKASYENIIKIFKEMTGAGSEETGGGIDIMTTIAPYIANRSIYTIDKILEDGDYFSILRDEVIKAITYNDATRTFTVVIDKGMVGFDKNITLTFTLDANKKLCLVTLDTTYKGYAINAEVTLKDNTSPIPEITDISNYIPCDSLVDIFSSKQISLNVSHATASKKSGETLIPLFEVNGTIDAKINDAVNEDDTMLDRVEAVLDGTMTFSDDQYNTHNFTLAYDANNASVKLGNLLKVYCTRDELKEMLKKEEEPDPEDPEAPKEDSDAGDMFIPILRMLSQRDYAEILKVLSETTLTVNGSTGISTLSVKVSNDIFNEREKTEEETFFTVDINFNAGGIDSIDITDLKYGNLYFSGTASLAAAPSSITPVNVEGYNHVTSIMDAFDVVEGIGSTLGVEIEILSENNKINGVDATLVRVERVNNVDDTQLSSLKTIDTADQDKVVSVLIAELEAIEEKTSVQQAQLDALNALADKAVTVAEAITALDALQAKDGYYLIYQVGTKADKQPATPIVSNDEDIVRVKLTSNDIESVINNIDYLLHEQHSPIADYLANMLTGNNSSSEEKKEDEFNIADLFKKGFINNMVSDEVNHTLTITIDKDALGLDSDATLVLSYNQETPTSNYTLETVSGTMSMKGQDFRILIQVGGNIADNEKVITPDEIAVIDARPESGVHGGWVNASTVNESLNYVKGLDPKTTQSKVVEQIQGLLDIKTAGLSYVITLTDLEDDTLPVVTVTGDIDFDLAGLNFSNLLGSLDKVKIGVTSGTITDDANTLNTKYDIRLIDGEAFLCYQRDASNPDDEFKVKYAINSINDLRDLLYEEAKSNPSLEALINTFFAGSTEEGGSPLSKAMSSGNYIALLNYFKGFSIEDNYLLVTFDGSLIESDHDIVIGLSTSAEKGIDTIKIINFQSFGQSINATLTFDGGDLENKFNYDEANTSLTTEVKDSYVNLNYLNDIVEDLINLFSENPQQEAVTLSGEFNGMKFNLSLQFDLNKGPENTIKVNEGKVKGYIAIGAKTHYIELEITAKLYQTEAEYKSIKAKADALNSIYNRTIADQISIFEKYEDKTSIQSVLNALYTIPESRRSRSMHDEAIYLYSLGSTATTEQQEQLMALELLGSRSTTTQVNEEIMLIELKHDEAWYQNQISVFKAIEATDVDALLDDQIAAYAALISPTQEQFEDYATLLSIKESGFDNTISQYISFYDALLEPSVTEQDILTALMDTPTSEQFNTISQQKAKFELVVEDIDVLNSIKNETDTKTIDDQIAIYRAELNAYNKVISLGIDSLIQKQIDTYTAQLDILDDVESADRNNTITQQVNKYNSQISGLFGVQNKVLNKNIREYITELEAISSRTPAQEEELTALKAIRDYDDAMTVTEQIATMEALKTKAKINETQLAVLKSLPSTDTYKSLVNLISEYQGDSSKTEQLAVLEAIRADYVNKTVGQHIATYEVLSAVAEVQENRLAILDTISTKNKTIAALIAEIKAVDPDDRTESQNLQLMALKAIENYDENTVLSEKIDLYNNLENKGSIASKLSVLRSMKEATLDKTIAEYITIYQDIEDRTEAEQATLDALLAVPTAYQDKTVLKEISYYQNAVNVLEEVSSMYRNNTLDEQVDIYNRFGSVHGNDLEVILAAQENAGELSIADYINAYNDRIDLLNTIKGEHLESFVNSLATTLASDIDTLSALSAGDRAKTIASYIDELPEGDLKTKLVAIHLEDQERRVGKQLTIYNDLLKDKEDDAYEESLVQFSYGDANNTLNDDGSIKEIGAEPSEANKMYGKFTLNTITDLFGLFTNLSSNENISALMEIFSGESQSSAINDILSGDVRAILYNKIINSLDYVTKEEIAAQKVALSNIPTSDRGHTINAQIAYYKGLGSLITPEQQAILDALLTTARADRTHTIAEQIEIYNLIDDKTSFYSLSINGELFKTDDQEEAKDIVLVIAKYDAEDVTDKKFIRYINVDGIYQGNDINAELSRVDYDPDYTTDVGGWSGAGKEQYELSNFELLGESIINTADTNDFILSGTLPISVMLLGSGTANIDAQLHIDTNTYSVKKANGEVVLEEYSNYYARLILSNIPNIAYVSEYGHNWRTFTLYIVNEVVVGEDGLVVFDADGNVVRRSLASMRVDQFIEGGWFSSDVTREKGMTITLGEFMDDIAYYLFNYGIGIKDKIGVGSGQVPASMKNTGAESDYQPTYSTILKEYTYYESGKDYDSGYSNNPLWIATIDLKNLLNNDILGNTSLEIEGSSSDVLSRIKLTVPLVVFNTNVATATINLNYPDTSAVMSQSVLNEIKNYVNAHEGETAFDREV